MFQRTKDQRRRSAGRSGIALTALPAYGQQQLERVEITGSSLRRVDAETALPVTVIKVEELAKQGVTNAEQALHRISANQSQLRHQPARSAPRPAASPRPTFAA